MARTQITETVTAKGGVVPTFVSFDITANPDGSYFDNSDQDVLLYVKNTDAAAHVLHIYTQSTRAGGKAVKDYVESIAAGTEEVFGPFANADFGVAGVVHVDIYDAAGPTFDADDAVSGGTKDTTGVTVAAIKMGAL